MLIDPDKIREVAERTDLVSLVGRHVQLRRSGRSFKGLCPFHGEKTPSFYVNPDRHSYKCFGCGKGGDAIRFVMEYEGKDFPSAVRELAAAAGIPLVFDPEEDKRLQERRALLHACDVAARFFEEQLWGKKGEPGRAHLRQRGVSETTARRARLGYASLDWHELRKRLIHEGVDLKRAQQAGLLGFKERPGARPEDCFYDVFRGRLMVPIADADGRVIAFGGRVVEGDDDRKYINTRETPLYVKSRVLYGLDTARDSIRRSRSATLVEGYFDAIALREAGIEQAVALCSTALTPEHVAMLKRLEVTQVDLVLDGDEAGRNAAMKLAGPLLAQGLSARVLLLPEGDDPDDFLRARGREGYEALQVAARPLSAYVIERAFAGQAEGYEARLRGLEALRPLLSALPEGAARSLFVGEVAGHLGLTPADVAMHFRGDLRRTDRQQASPSRPAPPPPRGPRAAPAMPIRRRELELVASVLAHPALAAESADGLAARIAHPALRELLFRVAAGEELGEAGAFIDPAIAQALDKRVAARAAMGVEACRSELLDGLIQMEREELLEERRAVIEERTALENELLGATEPQRQQELIEALADCRARLHALREDLEELQQRLLRSAQVV